MAQTPRETEPGAVTPPGVQDLRNTSDVRLIMIQVAKVEERIENLREENKGFKADFRWTWSGIAAGVVLMLGVLFFAYFRLDDRINTLSTGQARIETKIDDLIQRTPAPAVVRPQPQH